VGPYTHKHFFIKPGMTIGRKVGDILLEDDPTISSLHGRVIGRPDGRLFLEDAGSSNQFLMGGRQVAKLELAAGAVFQIGKSVFEVIAVQPQDLAKLSPQKNWKDLVFDHLENNREMGPSVAKPFSPAIKIECLEGPNAEDIWTLGFGPRLFGPACEDIEILENNSADVSFEIFQGDLGPSLRSKTQKLSVNRRFVSIDTEVNLSDGDEIQVGESRFKVHSL